VIEELVPAAGHGFEQYANNRVEADHARRKARLRPMRAVKTIRSLPTISAGHAVGQNLRRRYYPITADLPARDRVRVACDELALYL
jgi:transposase-like protein